MEFEEWNDIDTLTHKITKQYHSLEEKNSELVKILNNYNIDSEIKALKDENTSIRMRSLVTLTEKELKDLGAFRMLHYAKHPDVDNNIWDFRLVYTGIATQIVVTCPYCNESKDITDYSSW